MKLLTTIPARRDGTLNVTGADGTVYEGTANTFGDIEFDIPCELTVAGLLAGGKFYPADEEDFDVAETLLSGGDNNGADSGDADEAGNGDAGEAGNQEANPGDAAQKSLPAEQPAPTAKPKNSNKKK